MIKSIFEYAHETPSLFQLFRRIATMQCRMYKGEKVFNYFTITEVELLDDNVLVYKVKHDGYDYLEHLKLEKFQLINQKKFDCILSTHGPRLLMEDFYFDYVGNEKATIPPPPPKEPLYKTYL